MLIAGDDGTKVRGPSEISREISHDDSPLAIPREPPLMAKKILGDDPFSSEPRTARTDADAPKGKASTKAKRAPARKTEAPKAMRAPVKAKKAAPTPDRKIAEAAPPVVDAAESARVESPPVVEE